MPPYDLAEQATLFECNDSLDEELSGQAMEQGTLREMIGIAMTWADCRLGGARIVTTGGVQLYGCEIERIHWYALDE